GKTGTNNESTSTWFVGYTSELATASWMGRYTNINETLEGSTVGGRNYDDVWGSIIAGPMWVDYMKTAGPQYDTDEFPAFDGPTGDPSTEGNSSADDRAADSDSESDDSDSDDGDSDEGDSNESSDEDDSAGDND